MVPTIMPEASNNLSKGMCPPVIPETTKCVPLCVPLSRKCAPCASLWHKNASPRINSSTLRNIKLNNWIQYDTLLYMPYGGKMEIIMSIMIETGH